MGAAEPVPRGDDWEDTSRRLVPHGVYGTVGAGVDAVAVGGAAKGGGAFWVGAAAGGSWCACCLLEPHGVPVQTATLTIFLLPGDEMGRPPAASSCDEKGLSGLWDGSFSGRTSRWWKSRTIVGTAGVEGRESKGVKQQGKKWLHGRILPRGPSTTVVPSSIVAVSCPGTASDQMRACQQSTLGLSGIFLLYKSADST